ncbi:GMP/IMP nucleotidase [Endothiovibrio diazotrophicus]
MIDWNQIDTVLLDMDGTLLDLHFDNHFWLEHVPRRWAELHGLSLAEAKAELVPRYRAVEGTLDWYSVDYWSAELGMDIPLLKLEVEHLIAVHPHVVEFLDAVRAAGRRMLLVTNAHTKVLDLKLARTRLGGHFDRVFTSHQIGVPKEDPGFWPLLRGHEAYDPARTLLVDDSLPVLRSAEAYGIRHLLAVRRPDTRMGEKDTEEFAAIDDFSAIMPNVIF